MERRAENGAGAPPAWVLDGVIGLLAAIWGSTYFVIRVGLHDLPPFTSLAARFAVGAAVFAALGPTLARRERGGPAGWRLSLVFGLTSVAGPYGLVYWSERVLPSGLVSVLWATFPMMMAASARFALGERLGPRQAAGFLLGFAGVVVLFATDLRAVGADAVGAGALLLLSPLLATVGTTYVKRHGREASSALLNRNGLAIGCAVIAVLALAVERDEPAHWTPRAVGSVLYLALLGTVVAFGAYFWALRHAPAHRLSTTAYLTPALALTLGTLAGDEPFGATTAVGSGLILAGVVLVLRRARA